MKIETDMKVQPPSTPPKIAPGDFALVSDYSVRSVAQVFSAELVSADPMGAIIDRGGCSQFEIHKVDSVSLRTYRDGDGRRHERTYVVAASPEVEKIKHIHAQIWGIRRKFKEAAEADLAAARQQLQAARKQAEAKYSALAKEEIMTLLEAR